VRQPIEPAPVFLLVGTAVRSETLVADVGAYHLALTTVLPDCGIELESFYTGHDRLGESRVTHLLLAPSKREFDEHELRHSEIPVLFARRRCLYDHLQRLQQFADEIGLGALQVDVGEQTLLAIEA
jgi:hypothetical protein